MTCTDGYIDIFIFEIIFFNKQRNCNYINTEIAKKKEK